MSKRKTKGLKEQKLEKSEEKIQPEKPVETLSSVLAEAIKTASQDLYYSSEIEAQILPFIGKQTESLDKEILLAQIGKADAPVEERKFTDFFGHLTEIQDWFGDKETATAKRFGRLKEVLENNLRDLKVYKVGEGQLDVYVVGLDAENVLSGIKMESVET